MTEFDVVTGAFSYTGRYIAQRLLADGRRVKTLSRQRDAPGRLAGEVEVAPFAFDDPAALTASLRGAGALYNTYWVRFPHGEVTYERAIENTLTLLRAARDAGVRKVVHISVTNPSPDSPLPYFRGKARLEEAVRESGLRYAVVRPTLIVGSEDILLNNIAWILRRLPIFLVPGRGDYRVQPVAAEDVADLAVEAAAGDEDLTLDAVGPETYTFEELVRAIGRAVGSRARMVHAPPAVVLFLCGVAGLALRDVVLTREELSGLTLSLLVSDGPVTGGLRFSEWLAANGNALGRAYVSELARNYRAPV